MSLSNANTSTHTAILVSSTHHNHTNTTHIHRIPQWNGLAVMSLVTFVLGILGNLPLLILFVKDKTLWTPFNIYLGNLLLCNTMLVLVQYPFDVVANLYDSEWYMGYHACTFYLYGVYILQAVAAGCHQCIALNRVWAVIHPMSYRRRNTFRTAVIICLIMWVVIHLSVTPGWIMDTLYYRVLKEEEGCLLNIAAQRRWATFCQICIYDWPIVAMILALIIITVFQYRRWRLKLRHLGAVVPESARRATDDTSHAIKVKTCNIAIATVSKSQQQVDTESVPKSLGEEIRSTPVSRRMRLNRGNIILSLLTLSTVVTWTPIDVVFTMELFTHGEWPMLYYVSTIIFAFQPVIDPFLFTLALGTVRDAIRRVIHFS